MNISNPRKYLHYLPLTVLVISLFAIYLNTLAPGLTWANGGSDGGDLITAAYTGGIAHPSGYPLYLILARLFQFIPIGSLAYRTNLMSVVATIFSALFIYKLVVQALENSNKKYAWVAGMTAGFAFGLSPLIWSQAVITEVYALQALVTILLLFLSIYSFDKKDHNFLENVRGLAFGLAMGNHVTTVFLFPLLIFSGNKKNKKEAPNAFVSSITRRVVWFLLGLSVYFTLPLRALTNPPINWGNPITLKRLWWLISGELYQSYYLQFQLDGIGERIQAWASLLIQQFGLLGVGLGLIGLIFLYKPTRLYFYMIWMSAIYSLFAILYTASDSHVYLFPLYIAFSIWIGLAVGDGLHRLTSRSNLFRLSIGVLCVGYFLFHAVGYAGQVDASKDSRAEMFGRQVMSEVPKDALVFAKGDRAVFSLWYFHFALGERPDMIVIADDLLHFDWYQESLESTYPMVNLPDKAPWARSIANANAAQPVCYVQYTSLTKIDCD